MLCCSCDGDGVCLHCACVARVLLACTVHCARCTVLLLCCGARVFSHVLRTLPAGRLRGAKEQQAAPDLPKLRRQSIPPGCRQPVKIRRLKRLGRYSHCVGAGGLVDHTVPVHAVDTFLSPVEASSDRRSPCTRSAGCGHFRGGGDSRAAMNMRSRFSCLPRCCVLFWAGKAAEGRGLCCSGCWI